jgi:hypothetical protein
MSEGYHVKRVIARIERRVNEEILAWLKCSQDAVVKRVKVWGRRGHAGWVMIALQRYRRLRGSRVRRTIFARVASWDDGAAHERT